MEIEDDVVFPDQMNEYEFHRTLRSLESPQSMACIENLFDAIARNLRELEHKYRPTANYIETVQQDITAHMREILIDWLGEVATEFRLKPETLCLAVNFVDRYLSHVVVPRSKLQLVGVCCMLIASKYEEIKPPTLDDFVYITDRTYVRDELLRMELSILKILGFSLTVTTARDFMGIFLKTENANQLVRMLTDYLLELTFQEYAMIKYLPSVVVASAVKLAQFTISSRPSSQALAFYSQRHQSEITECMRDMLRVWQHAPHNPLQSVREKYSHTRFMRVSTHVDPPAQSPV
jgi:cyclin A